MNIKKINPLEEIAKLGCQKVCKVPLGDLYLTRNRRYLLHVLPSNRLAWISQEEGLEMHQNSLKEKPESVVIFDQTSYWVEEGDYKPDVEDEEEIVFTGTFEACSEKCEQLNDELRG